MLLARSATHNITDSVADVKISHMSYPTEKTASPGRLFIPQGWKLTAPLPVSSIAAQPSQALAYHGWWRSRP